MRFICIWMLAITFCACNSGQNKSSELNLDSEKTSNELTASGIEEMLNASLDIDKRIEKLQSESGREDILFDLKEKQEFLDSTNALSIAKHVRANGWIKKSEFGNEASDAALKILLRGPARYQEDLLAIISRSVDSGEANGVYVAEIVDLSRIRKGEKQFFGTQLSSNSQKGRKVIYPIFDEKNLEARRYKMGLEPMKTYWESRNIHYSSPE